MSGQFWEIEASCQQIRHFPEYVEGPGRKGQWLRGSCRQSPGQEWAGSKGRLWRCVLWISLPTAACFHCCCPPWPSISPAGSNRNSPFRKWIKQPVESGGKSQNGTAEAGAPQFWIWPQLPPFITKRNLTLPQILALEVSAKKKVFTFNLTERYNDSA